jgi:hypothetical protein
VSSFVPARLLPDRTVLSMYEDVGRMHGQILSTTRLDFIYHFDIDLSFFEISLDLELDLDYSFSYISLEIASDLGNILDQL